MEENVLQINPELARRCLQSAHLCMETNRFKEALKLFDEIIGKHQPQNVEAHLESAKIYAIYKQPNSILKVINRLHNFSPEDSGKPRSSCPRPTSDEPLFRLSGKSKGDFYHTEGFS